MVGEVERLISEIVQIKNQYVAEVGSGRRVWPKSIKERVARLDEMGLPPKVVASRTTISYDTVVLWRYNRRHGVNARIKTGFHQLKVSGATSLPEGAVDGGSGISKSVAVTVPETKMPIPGAPSTQRAALGLRLTTPRGFVVDGLNESTVAQLIRSLSQSGGAHVL
jgi:hypothetical protein